MCGSITLLADGAGSLRHPFLMPGETVVMLHSSASSGNQWRALIEQLPAGWRGLAPDLYGYGCNPGWPGECAFSLAAESRLVRSLLPDPEEPVHLVGHSYGGAVALRMAVERPDLVASLTLFEPVAFHVLATGSTEDRALLDSASTLAARVAGSLLTGEYAGAMQAFVDFWNGPGTWTASSDKFRSALCTRLAKLPLDFAAVIDEPISLRAYSGLRIPTLILEGERSPAITRRITALLADSMRTARKVTVPEVGHMAPISDPAAINGRIVRHLCASSIARFMAA